MTTRRSILSFTVAAGALLAGCGGGDDFVWDVLRPRDATIADIEAKSFVFTDFSFGAVFDTSLSTSTTTLAFAAAQAANTGYTLPFSLSAKGATASGTATLEGQRLLLTFTQASASLPFTTAKALDFDIQADVDDGRIGLTNRETNIQQTSAPNR